MIFHLEKLFFKDYEKKKFFGLKFIKFKKGNFFRGKVNSIKSNFESLESSEKINLICIKLIHIHIYKNFSCLAIAALLRL